MRFNKRYKVYLDANYGTNDSAWVEVFPDIEPFKKAPFQKEMFTRYSFAKFIFRNTPKYSGDAAETYNTIANADIDQEIRIKIEIQTDLVVPDTSNEIIGYFGTNDCEFDEDKKIITVTPTIFDQYTDLVENWDTEVFIFGEEDAKKAEWRLPENFSTLFPGGIGYDHNIPVVVVSSDYTESKDVSAYVLSYLFEGSVVNYTANFSVYIYATLSVSVSGYTKLYLNIYDGDDVLQETNLLKTVNPVTNGVISETYTVDTTITKGYSVKLFVDIDNSGDLVHYDIVVVKLNTVSIAIPTFDVDVNLANSFLKTYDIWTEVNHGFSDRFKKNDFESDVVDLNGYFEVDGSPKDSQLFSNVYAPHGGSIPIDSNTLKELGGSVISMDGLYLPTDLETVLGNYDLEISDLTVFLCKSNGWWVVHPWRRTRATCKWSRFEQYLTDGETPVDSGWTDTGFVNSSGKRLFTKKPFGGTITTWTKGTLDTSGGTNAFGEYVHILNSTKLPNYPDSDTSVSIQAVDLRDIIKTVYNGTFPSLVNEDVESVFFWNDTDPLITVEAGQNYAYPDGEINWLNKIAVAHTYQLKEVDEESEDSILKISFKDLMADLKVLFNNQIFWWVETDGTLRIEHLKYIDETKTVLDLTQGVPYSDNVLLLTEISSWKYEKSEMFSLVTFEIVNSGYKDFTNNNMTFDKIVSNKRNEDVKNTLATKIMTTDIQYCIESPADLENGMILLNYDDNYDVVNATTPISNSLSTNGNIALSNLLTRYKYEGIFLEGAINGGNVLFNITTRTKIGKEILIKGIYDYDYFKSKLGVGLIESLTHNLDKEITTIILAYRFGSGSETDQFILMVSEVGDFVGATDIMFNFG